MSSPHPWHGEDCNCDACVCFDPLDACEPEDFDFPDDPRFEDAPAGPDDYDVEDGYGGWQDEPCDFDDF